MKIRSFPLFRTGFQPRLLAAVLGALLILSSPARSNDPNPGVIPPSSAPNGQTSGELSAKWVKWAFEQPLDKSPLADTSGANCAVGQPNDVWFLAGTFGPGDVTRTCTVPAGRILFFPVGNGFCFGDKHADNTSFSFAEERACATSFASQWVDFKAEVDGVQIDNIYVDLQQNPYRGLSPSYSIAIPESNLFGAPAGIYDPGAADGVYVMLSPLSPGPHAISFGAKFNDGTRSKAKNF